MNEILIGHTSKDTRNLHVSCKSDGRYTGKLTATNSSSNYWYIDARLAINFRFTYVTVIREPALINALHPAVLAQQSIASSPPRCQTNAGVAVTGFRSNELPLTQIAIMEGISLKRSLTTFAAQVTGQPTGQPKFPLANVANIAAHASHYSILVEKQK
jgi:hypothetical protein